VQGSSTVHGEEWQQYKDHSSPTGFIYIETYTKTKRVEAPALFIPFDQVESGAMRFFRRDRVAARGTAMNTPKYLTGVLTVAVLLYLGEKEYDRRYKEPERRAVQAQYQRSRQWAAKHKGASRMSREEMGLLPEQEGAQARSR
jgi:hypothetical protein